MKIGVLALQGAFREHRQALESLGVEAIEVRLPGQLEGLDGLILPGGESTAIAKLMDGYGFYEAIAAAHDRGMAVWGTCAGMILLAARVVEGLADQRSLSLMEIEVRRNAFGRQVNSFEAPLDFAGIGQVEGVFIRAPWVESIGENVKPLATHDGHLVACRQGDLMATAFHPELTGDNSVHRYFVERVVGSRKHPPPLPRSQCGNISETL